MKRITLAIISLVAVAGVGVAQEPPTPPVRPTPAAPVPAPAPRPAQAPVGPTPRVAPVAPFAYRDFDFRLDQDQIREITRHAEEMAREASRIDQEQVREMAREASRVALEATRIDQEHIREMAREASRIDAEQIARNARDIARNFDFDYMQAPVAVAVPRIAPMPAMAPMAMPYIGGRDFTDRPVPAPWIQGDPADSVYKIARDALNNGDYGRAARMFNEVVQKYGAKSQLLDASQYYEALARYKIGTTDELHQASKILEPMVAKLPVRASPSDNSRETRVGTGVGTGCGGFGCTSVVYTRTGFSDSEVAALYARVNGTLAQRGDQDAKAKIEKFATQTGGTVCDREDLDVRTEALNALSQMDAATSLPVLKKVIERKDDCSAQLRRSAVFMLGRRSDAEAATLLIAVAKTDPSIDVRSSAINYLGKLPGDAGLPTLEELLKSDQDERIQRAAVRSLNASDNVHARTSMRALIDRKDAPMNLRIEAINSFSSDRATADDAAYLRGLYAKADNDRMREEILNTLSRIGGTDNDAFVLGVAKNGNESSRLRAQALSRLSRSPTVTSADLGKIYDTADSYDVRSRIVQILGSRKDPESADKLIDVVRNSTDSRVKRDALQAIMRRNDPRATQLLNDIIEGKKP